MSHFPEWFEVDYKGQWFRPVAVTPHTRMNGQATVVVTWSAQCIGCGDSFTMQTGKVFKNPTRRCALCRSERVKK